MSKFAIAKITCALIIATSSTLGTAYALAEDQEVTHTQNTSFDTTKMERQLQQLPWAQVRAAIESVPKLRADLDTYGEIGWAYVKSKYATYPWKQKIDRLDDDQKRKLDDLLEAASARSER